ncbi:MAG TPA: cation:dicarboxylase symporter family transporter [Prolixibacteraceae bacterium]|nr:cation:dicarboxylase symporter family transporter [Prolixibacteraceae bacterium]
MNQSENKSTNFLNLACIAVSALSALLLVLTGYKIIAVDPDLFTAIRCFNVGLLSLFALKRKSLTVWILIAIVAGAEFGHDLPEVSKNMQFLSDIFIRLIKTIIAPLIFATLVNGIAGHNDLKLVGRLGWKSILYFEIVSTIALFIGLVAINISKAGVGLTLPADASVPVTAAKAHTWSGFLLNMFPENIAKSVFDGNILQVVVFSIIFGVAVARVPELYRKTMLRFTESLAETMFKFTNIIMYYAPVAVFGAIAFTIGHLGLDILGSLVKLLATLYAALIIFVLVVILPLLLFLKIPIKKFIAAVSEPASIAFATANSESALPAALENMERFGVPRKIVAFVIPTGYSFNLDGTTLYLSLACVFVAQVAGIDLSVADQLVLCLMLMLTSKGTAGVSRAALVVLLGTLSSFGLPTTPVFLILGIDVLMDMARTTVNVIGNCTATVVMAKWENAFDEEKARGFENEG